MLLTSISKYIKCKKTYNLKDNSISFNHISTNSKDIKKSSLFAIINNSKDHFDYAKEAIAKGSVGIITNKHFKNLFVNQFVVDDLNVSVRILLKKLIINKPLNSLAITGTNGKTSVAWYVSQICLLNKKPTKTYGTLGYYINNKKKSESFLTTPNFEVLYQASFSNKKNIYNFIFEASSHGIKQERFKNLPINIAAITNISQDHLDYHKTFKKYSSVKFNLFKKYLNNGGIAILNDNIFNIDFLKESIKDNIKIITYGKINSDINLEQKKNDIKIKFFKNNYTLKSIIFNQVDLENIACSIACCHSLNIKIEKILSTIKKIKKPPGRLEKILNKKNYRIFVDYAHTPDALKKVLINNTSLNIKPNILFGCGGNRDKEKRSKMGFIANNYANKIYITDDNPRDEDPKLIRKKILDNCKRGVEIADRKKAIFQAINELKKNEVLIIAGKGHEKFQINKGLIKKFDDVEVAKLAVQKK